MYIKKTSKKCIGIRYFLRFAQKFPVTSIRIRFGCNNQPLVTRSVLRIPKHLKFIVRTLVSAGKMRRALIIARHHCSFGRS